MADISGTSVGLPRFTEATLGFEETVASAALLAGAPNPMCSLSWLGDCWTGVQGLP
jgi:hypothetical protein